MADKTGTIRITASTELGELQKLNGSLEKMEAGFLKSVGAASLLNKGVGALLGVIKEGYADLDKYSKATVAFTGNLSLMREATKGAVADLDLMRAANKMTTLGVNLTSQEMATLLGDVKKLSAAMGIDMKDALESTATALARESDKIADNVGIVMKAESAQEKYAASIGKVASALTDAEKKLAFQKEFLEQAHAKASKLAEGNVTLTGTFTRLGASIKNTTMSLLHFLNTFGSSGWESMSPQMRGNGFSTWRGGYAKQGWGVGGAGPGDDETGPGDFGAGGIAGAEEWGTARTGMTGYGMGLGYGKLAEGGLRGTKRSRRGGGRGAKDFTSPFGVAEWMDDSLKKIEDMVAARSKRIADLMQKQREGDVEAEAEGERGRLGAEFKKFTEQKGRETKGGKLRDTFAGKLFGDDVMQGAIRSREELALYERQVESLNATMKDFTTGSLADLAGGMWAAADAAIQGGEGFGMAMLKMVKSTLLGIAQQATVKAIFSTAEGFALQAATMGIPNPGSVAAFTAAGLYASVALGAGAVGLGMSAAMGSGKSAGGSGASSSSGANYRPSFGTKTSSKDLPPIVVRVTFDRSDPAAEAFARRKVKADLVAAGYQDGV